MLHTYLLRFCEVYTLKHEYINQLRISEVYIGALLQKLTTNLWSASVHFQPIIMTPDLLVLVQYIYLYPYVLRRNMAFSLVFFLKGQRVVLRQGLYPAFREYVSILFSCIQVPSPSLPSPSGSSCLATQMRGKKMILERKWHRLRVFWVIVFSSSVLVLATRPRATYHNSLWQSPLYQRV